MRNTFYKILLLSNPTKIDHEALMGIIIKISIFKL